MKKFTYQEIKEFVSKPIFNEKIILKKDPSWPKISIVTPSYNQAKFLERTILSVLNQNYPNLEYIIIDGGSTDGSVEIIKKYEKHLAYWISEKDNGMYDAINKGLKIAKGDILAYLNSDDLYYPNTIRTAVDYFQNHVDTGLIYGDCDFIDSQDCFLYTYHYPTFKWRQFIVLNWSSIPQEASFWRRDVHKGVGYFNPEFKMAGDFEFYARVNKYFQIVHLRKVLAMHRLHKKSLTSSRPDKNQEEVKRLHRQYGISDGFVIICLRYLGEFQIKLLNFPLMIKKIVGIKKRFYKYNATQ